MTWASGSNQDFSDRYSHVGGDGMIFDNRKGMEVATKRCQKLCQSYKFEYRRYGFQIIGLGCWECGNESTWGAFVLIEIGVPLKFRLRSLSKAIQYWAVDGRMAAAPRNRIDGAVG